MEPTTAFLAAMQAAGMVASIAGAKSQQKMIRLGRQLETEQLQTNLEAIRLESADASLRNMRQLRQNLANQIVQNAALGRRGSVGAMIQSSRNFDEDERARRLNLLARESQLRANNLLSGMHTLQSETQLGQSLTSGLINTLPVSSILSDVGGKVKEGFGLGSSMYGGG